jgi:hypothetical protein
MVDSINLNDRSRKVPQRSLIELSKSLIMLQIEAQDS